MKAVLCRNCKYFRVGEQICEKQHSQSLGSLNCAAYVEDKIETCKDCAFFFRKHNLEFCNNFDKKKSNSFLFEENNYLICSNFKHKRDFENSFKKNDGFGTDKQKNRLDLLPFKALEKVSEVMTYGATKYGANSWQKLSNFEERYKGALLRHLFAYLQGDLIDKESRLTHLQHLATNALFLLDKEEVDNE